MNEIPGDVLSKMGDTERWIPSTDIEIVWNDRVLCVVDRQTKKVVLMVMSWMTGTDSSHSSERDLTYLSASRTGQIFIGFTVRWAAHSICACSQRNRSGM